MKIFVLGATGNIGYTVSVALSARGHHVIGLVRNPNSKRALELVKNEVEIIQGSLEETQTWENVAENCSVLVYCAKDNTEAVKTVVKCAETHFLRQQQIRPLVLYTSGCLIYQESEEFVDETAPVNTRSARYASESAVLQYGGVVARPAFLYGGNMSYLASYWNQLAVEGVVQVKGNPNKRYNVVHFSDLADGYVRIVESASNLIRGEIFNFGDDSSLTALELATHFAKVAGYSGSVSVVPNQNDLDKYFDRYALVDAAKARRVLGWAPLHHLARNTHLYYQAWKASVNPAQPLTH